MKVTAKTVQDAYEAAIDIAVSVDVLSHFRFKTAKEPNVVFAIRLHAPPILRATWQLLAITKQSDILTKAAHLHPDIVRCGNHAGESHLGLAFGAGEIATRNFTMADQRLMGFYLGVIGPPMDCNGVVAVWDDPADFFSCLFE